MLKHKMQIDAVLMYTVHLSGSNLLETSNTKGRTCRMYGPVKKKKSTLIHLEQSVFPC